MRILHTSDWHLGKMLYKRSRAEDHAAVLQEIIDIARTEEPDLTIHSGDLFDHRRPSYHDEGAAIDALQNLAAVAPVVVVRGNHDSPHWFRHFSRAFGPRSGIHLIDSPRDPKNGGVLYFPGPNDTILRLGVLPFVEMGQHIDVFDDPEQWYSAHAQAVGKLERELAAELLRDLDTTREIAVFTAHEYIRGAELTGSERAIHTANDYAINPDDLPAVSYAAFGHIHKPQPLPGKVTGCYAGSPLQLDLGEENEQKSVVIVDLDPGQPAKVNRVPLSKGRRVRSFTGTLEDLRAAASTFDRELCLFKIHTETNDPTLSEQVLEIVPDVTILGVIPLLAGQKLEIVTQDNVISDAEPDMRGLFDEYLAIEGGTKVAAPILQAQFGRLLTCLEEEGPFTMPDVEALLVDSLDDTAGNEESVR